MVGTKAVWGCLLLVWGILPLSPRLAIAGRAEQGGMTERTSGLRYFDLTVGQGESPVAGDTVTVNYVASFASQGQVITREHYGT